MKTQNEKISGVIKAVIPMLISFALCMLILFIKGIYPFGTGRIDSYDMGQLNAPMYYHIWDFLHGKSPLMFNWYINQGQNISMGSAVQWNISVFNLFFLFVKRDMILKSLSLFTVLRISFSALSAYITLNYIFRRLNYVDICILSVLYSLSGYALQYYTITTFIDMAVLAPLIFLGLYRLLKEDKCYFYVLIFGYSVALSYYLTYMNALMIFFVSATYLWFFCPREKVGKKVFNLIFCSILAIGLAGFMLIPSVLQMVGSSRFEENAGSGLLESIKSIYTSYGADMYYSKWWMLFGMTYPLTIVVRFLIKDIKKIKRNFALVAFLGITLLLIPVESINIIWHMGPYYHYPIRCAYLIALSIVFAASFCINEDEELSIGSMNSIKNVAAIIVGAGLCSVCILYYSNKALWDVNPLFKCSVLLFIVLFALYLFVGIFDKKNKFGFVCIALLLMELLVGIYVFLGPVKFITGFAEGPEQTGDFIEDITEIARDFNIEQSGIERIKNPDTSLNANYPIILRRAALSGWEHTVGEEQLNAAVKLGYTRHFVRILDSGGTYFSDALLNVKDVISKVELPDNAEYEYVADNGEYYYYKNKATLPFCIVYNKADANMDIHQNDIVKIHNLIYQAISGDESDIASKIEISDSKTMLSVQGKKAIYCKDGKYEKLIVNGKTITNPVIGDMENTVYPSEFSSNLIHLGDFENEDVDIEFDLGEDGKLPKIVFEIDLVKLEKLCEEKSAEEIKVTEGKSSLGLSVISDSDDKVALIPLNYDEGFNVWVNGQKVLPYRAMGLFMAIPVEKGNNEISISFAPSGLNLGFIISAISLGLFLLCILISYKKLIPDTIENTAYAVAQKVILPVIFAALCMSVVIIYVMPILVFILHQVLKRL